MWFTTGMWVIKSRSFLGWGRKFILICVWRRITHLKWKRKKYRSLVSSNFTLNKLGVYCFVMNFKATRWSILINLKRVRWKSDLSMVVGHSIKYQTPLGVRPLNILFVFFFLYFLSCTSHEINFTDNELCASFAVAASQRFFPHPCMSQNVREKVDEYHPSPLELTVWKDLKTIGAEWCLFLF